jgi:hypothetical protein
MLIEYIHENDPGKVKIHDTEKVRKNTFFYNKTQKEVDEFEIKCFERDKMRGTILYYKILEAKQ